jgi:hypothetical protein
MAALWFVSIACSVIIGVAIIHGQQDEIDQMTAMLRRVQG